MLGLYGKLRESKQIKNHTHHRVVARGLSPLRAILLMGFSAGFAGLIGLAALYQQPLVANLLFAALLLIGLIAFYILDLSNPR